MLQCKHRNSSTRAPRLAEQFVQPHGLARIACGYIVTTSKLILISSGRHFAGVPNGVSGAELFGPCAGKQFSAHRSLGRLFQPVPASSCLQQPLHSTFDASWAINGDWDLSTSWNFLANWQSHHNCFRPTKAWGGPFALKDDPLQLHLSGPAKPSQDPSSSCFHEPAGQEPEKAGSICRRKPRKKCSRFGVKIYMDSV